MFWIGWLILIICGHVNKANEILGLAWGLFNEFRCILMLKLQTKMAYNNKFYFLQVIPSTYIINITWL